MPVNGSSSDSVDLDDADPDNVVSGNVVPDHAVPGNGSANKGLTEKEGDHWFVYILRCADNSLYTGITTDINKRLKQHNGIEKCGAKYTRGRQPVMLIYQESSISRSSASKREIEIKRLPKVQKEKLIQQYRESALTE